MPKISPKRKRFDPKNAIPLEWRIPYSGQHFYRFGFSQYRNDCTDRSKLYHPLIVFPTVFIFCIKYIYLSINAIKTFEFHLYIGDFGHFMGMKFHLNFTASLLYGMASLSHIIHYYNYLCIRGQLYMNVFFVMSGETAPNSIGLTDEKTISDLLSKTRINPAFKLNDFIHFSIVVMAFIITIASYLRKDSSIFTVFVSLLQSLIFSFTTYYVFNIISSQITYFYIICYYLKLKQREVNNYLRKVIKNKERIKIYIMNRIIAKLNQIYEEIKEYDSVFWSKFLALTWMLCATSITFTIHVNLLR